MPQDASSAPNQTRLVDLAYARIKREITRCALKPGVLVTEQYLTSTYQLGKAPVRAALVRLGQESLVRSVPRRGYEIAPVTLRDVQELMDLRRLLEGYTARRAAGRVDVAALTRLDAACRAGYHPGDSHSEEAFMRANRDVHLAVARMAGNQRVVNALAGVFDATERVLYLGLSARDWNGEMGGGHAAFIEALASGDGGLAERLAEEEVEESRRIVINSLLQTTEVLDATISTIGRPPTNGGEPETRRSRRRGNDSVQRRTHVRDADA